jgi:hypothetical protein
VLGSGRPRRVPVPTAPERGSNSPTQDVHRLSTLSNVRNGRRSDRYSCHSGCSLSRRERTGSCRRASSRSDSTRPSSWQRLQGRLRSALLVSAHGHRRPRQGRRHSGSLSTPQPRVASSDRATQRLPSGRRSRYSVGRASWVVWSVSSGRASTVRTRSELPDRCTVGAIHSRLGSYGRATPSGVKEPARVECRC